MEISSNGNDGYRADRRREDLDPRALPPEQCLEIRRRQALQSPRLGRRVHRDCARAHRGEELVYSLIQEEIEQDYYQQNFPNDGTRFVAWYLRNVHRRDPNQTKYEVTDGPDDKQIDAIVIDDDNSTVYLIQGKFIGASSVDAEPLREVLSAWLQIKNLVNLQETANSKLKISLVDLANALNEDYTIYFELITTSNFTDAAKNDLKIFQDELIKDEDVSASISFIDNTELRNRYEMALENEKPWLNHTFLLEEGKYLFLEIANTQIILASIPLKECIKFPGLSDGTLFRKNVRQFMGLNNKVNKSIKSTIYSDKNKDFFFYHNGITAICNNMQLYNNTVTLNGLNVVNGCQSLKTILACSEKVKELEDAYMLFRFYEIPQLDRAEKISTSTNFQSAVKPRDLRSNDKNVLNLKRSFEQRYPRGYFIRQRGEESPADKDKLYVVDLVQLGKWLISWHSQRPNFAYSETRIFDKYFEQLFRRVYDPENIQSLNLWMKEIMKGWTPDNPFGLNESLLAMKAYAPYHVLYSISQLYATASKHSDRVPSPKVTYQTASEKNVVEKIVAMAASCVNTAIETAVTEFDSTDKIFSPQNWVKTKICLRDIKTAARMQIAMLPTFSEELKEILTIQKEAFEYRWEAD